MGALATVITVIETLSKLEPVFVSTWNNLKPFATSLFTQFKGEEPTADELTELERQIDALAAASQEPLPEAQPGDPDYVKEGNQPPSA